MRIGSTTALVLALLLLAAAPAARAQGLDPLFPTPVAPAGAEPLDVAAGDFDGDGRADVATLVAGAVRVSLQVGVLRFAPPLSVALSGTPKRLLAVEATGDGNLDLLTSFDTVQVLRGDGQGGFVALPPLANSSSTWPFRNHATAADLGLDGLPEIIATDTANRLIVIWRATGSGTFGPPTSIALQPGPLSPADVVVAHVDGDVWPDLVASDFFNFKRAVILGTGSGAFGAPSYLPLANTACLAAADFDGDTLLDTASVNLGSPTTLRIERGDGAGGFTLLAQLQIPGTQNDPAELFARDLDRDGDPDLLLFGREGNVHAVANQGGGAFALSTRAVSGTTVAWGCDAADVDSDGIPDVVFPNMEGFTVVPSDGLGGFEELARLDLSGAGQAGGLRRCDADADGIADAAFLTTGSTLGVCLGDGAGGFAPAVLTSGVAPDHLEWALLDLDGDPFPDVVAKHFASGGLQARLGAGDGSFSPPALFSPAPSFLLGAGDYDGDGFDDAVSNKPPLPGGNSMGILLHASLGNGLFAAPLIVDLGAPLWDVRQALVRDFDGDGLADVLCAAGTKLGMVRQATPLQFASTWTLDCGALIRSFGLGDLNHDLLDDAVLALDDGRIAVALAAAGGTFATPASVALGGAQARGFAPEFGDFDRDGHTDFVVGCNDGTLRLFPGDGTGALLPQVRFATLTKSGGRAIALDADGDLDLDLVAGSPELTVRENRGVHARPLAFCTAKTNSLGCVPRIDSTGLASAAATSGFVVEATSVRNQKPGLLLYSLAGRAATPFGGAFLCLRAPVRRSVGLSSGGNTAGADCSGRYALDVNAFAAGQLGGQPAPGLRVPGSAVAAQFWGRDPGFAPPLAITLSDALEYLVEP